MNTLLCDTLGLAGLGKSQEIFGNDIMLFPNRETLSITGFLRMSRMTEKGG